MGGPHPGLLCREQVFVFTGWYALWWASPWTVLCHLNWADYVWAPARVCVWWVFSSG